MSGWKDSTAHVNTGQPLRMAEPMHRVPPTGATSQQSIRSIPKSSIQQVKEICLYYVNKCSGKYQNNKAAARYVHQMAEEIMFQLAGVANEIKMNRGEPEVYQSLLEEWNEHFPPSLGAIGSPKAIATLLANQARDIQRLKDELQIEKTKRENDVSAVLRSMDVQLHSYRSTVMNDRRQQRVLFNQELSSLEDQMKDMQAGFEEEKKSMNNQYNKEYNKLEAHYESLLKQSQKNLEEAIKTHEKEILKLKDRKDRRIQFLKDKIREMRMKTSELKQKYNMLAVVVNEEAESTSDDSDDELELDDSEDDEEESVSEVGSLLELDLEKRKVEKEERRKKRSQDRDEKLANMRMDAFSLGGGGGGGGGSASFHNGSMNGNGSAEEIRQLKEVNIVALANIKRLEKVQPSLIYLLIIDFALTIEID